MEKEYIYHVSFHHSKGQGSSIITITYELDTAKAISAVQKMIEETSSATNVGLTNWTRLKSL